MKHNPMFGNGRLVLISSVVDREPHFRDYRFTAKMAAEELGFKVELNPESEGSSQAKFERKILNDSPILIAIIGEQDSQTTRREVQLALEQGVTVIPLLKRYGNSSVDDAVYANANAISANLKENDCMKFSSSEELYRHVRISLIDCVKEYGERATQFKDASSTYLIAEHMITDAKVSIMLCQRTSSLLVNPSRMPEIKFMEELEKWIRNANSDATFTHIYSGTQTASALRSLVESGNAQQIFDRYEYMINLFKKSNATCRVAFVDKEVAPFFATDSQLAVGVGMGTSTYCLTIPQSITGYNSSPVLQSLVNSNDLRYGLMAAHGKIDSENKLRSWIEDVVGAPLPSNETDVIRPSEEIGYKEMFELELASFKERLVAYIRKSLPAGILGLDEASFMDDEYTPLLISQSSDGKCLRGFLVYMGYCICGGQDVDAVMPAAASYELYEAGILGHDDIIDRATLRRHRNSMHVALRETGDEHSGVARAICLGDIAMMSAIYLLGSVNGVSDALFRKMILYQTRIFNTTLAGELLDFDLSAAPSCTEDEILNMCRLKTAFYSVAAPLRLGALCASADDDVQRLLEHIGLFLGMAYQLQDDILGVYGDPANTGKTGSSDCAEGKKTIMSVHFREHASSDALERFEHLYGNEGIDESGVAQVQALFDEAGARTYAEEKRESFLNQALDEVHHSEFPAYAKRMLRGLAEYISQRQS